MQTECGIINVLVSHCNRASTISISQWCILLKRWLHNGAVKWYIFHKVMLACLHSACHYFFLMQLEHHMTTVRIQSWHGVRVMLWHSLCIKQCLVVALIKLELKLKTNRSALSLVCINEEDTVTEIKPKHSCCNNNDKQKI